ncbi:MAG: outer membrane beta-barrel protein [Bacteroidota bacterium]
MKKEIKIWSYLLACIALFMTTTLVAQTGGDEDNEPIEVEIKTGKDTLQAKILIKDGDDDDDDNDDDDDSDWDDDDDDWNIEWGNSNGGSEIKTSNGGRVRVTMLDIGLSGYLFDGGFSIPSDQDELDLLYGGSLNINFHLFRHRTPLVRNTLYFEYGLGFSWMQYKFANDFLILEDTDKFEFEPIEDDLEKNKLKTTFINVPLMLTLTPGKNNNYFISGGVYGGVLVGSKQKIETTDGDVSKFNDDFNLNKIRYGIEGRVGLGPVSFYAQYSLQDLFQEGRGPELTPINFGITVLGF